jgi:hypothetical protein
MGEEVKTDNPVCSISGPPVFLQYPQRFPHLRSQMPAAQFAENPFFITAIAMEVPSSLTSLALLGPNIHALITVPKNYLSHYALFQTLSIRQPKQNGKKKAGSYFN